MNDVCDINTVTEERHVVTNVRARGDDNYDTVLDCHHVFLSKNPEGPPATIGDSMPCPACHYSPHRDYYDILLVSKPMKIGKHEWRLVKVRGKYGIHAGQIYVEYEWRDPRCYDSRWIEANRWPRYDFNNGMTGGLPKSLRKLYDVCPWAHDIG